MRKTILWMLSILIIAQIAYAGVTNPLPTELNLFKGETGRFKFQVQTIASNRELECTPSLAAESPLVIEFDEEIMIIPAGTVRDIYGTVIVPDEIEFGAYEENFCVSCKPVQGISGTGVQIDTCDLPIKVNVVDERARDNMYVPPKETGLLLWQIVVLSVVLIAIALSLLYLWEKKHHLKRLAGKLKR